MKATWGVDGWILFSGIENSGVLKRIRDSGGTPERIVRSDIEKNEWYLYQPEMLPDGEHILFTGELPVLRVAV